jgi:pimeloyl-ACP methyl ester carboxylesterase
VRVLPVCLLLLLSAAPAAARQSAAYDSAAVPRIEFAEPPFAVPADLRDTIRFGWLTVPRDHDDPAAGTLRLALTIIAARTDAPAPDPILLLPGGPGGGQVARGTVGTARSERAGLHRQHRALVLLDPRGHGLSEPRTCPELDFGPLTEVDTVVNARVVRVLATCRERLTARGESAAVLSSVQVARDLDVLRRALGAPQLNLIGGSYGTRLAAEAMREVPWAVRAVVMRSPVPPGTRTVEGGESLGTLFARCAEQPSCARAFPDLAADYDSVLALAERAPLIVRVPRTGAPASELVLDSALLRQGLAELGFSRDLAAGTPLLVHTLARRGLRPLALMAPRMIERIGVIDEAHDTFQAFRCNDDPTSDEPSAVQRCRAFLGERYGDTLALPLRSDIPALVLVGEFDPRTPPSNAYLVAEGLPRGHVVVLPWHGHGLLSDCVFHMTDEFLRTPERAPDTSCADSLPRFQFATSIVPSRWVGVTVAHVAAHPLRVALPAGAALLLLLAPFVGVPARAVRLRRARGSTDRGAGLDIALWLAGVAGFAVVLGTAAAVVSGARQSMLVPALGVPVAWRWVLVLPWLLALLWGCALVLAARAPRAATRAHTALRWSGLTGAALLLALWLAASL